ncbi:hypothetical protein [Cellulosilyticum sp. I15G10I2]|uniref:hypothetical protein n=1 Tax=Cellulosilyticum sp. I15G10I2 TaxID=1892843 RepID=UPI00085C3215|nr:hypothetical protein [Cellulosilyticum sp. I15G10I2]
MKKTHIVFILSVVIAAVFYYFISASSPEKTLQKFERAYNKLDVNEMLDCFDPAYSRGIKAGLNFVGNFMEVDPNAILDTLPLIYEMSDSVLRDQPEYGDVKAKLTIDTLDVQKYDNKAEVKTRMTLQQGGNHKEITGTFYMFKKEGKWYIEDVK